MKKCLPIALLLALSSLGQVRASLTYTFNSATDVAVTSGNYTANGALSLSLGFAPTPGTNLNVIISGLSFISGTFINVPQGGVVPLTFNGVTYNYTQRHK